MKTTKVTITHLRDTDGSAIVKVSLINQDDKQAILNEEDFELLMSLGVTPCWLLTSNLVLVKGTRLSVARLIVDAKKVDHVKYCDGDPCNLRRSNLFITGGSAKLDARSELGNRP